jgi:hypothetical protein
MSWLVSTDQRELCTTTINLTLPVTSARLAAVLVSETLTHAINELKVACRQYQHDPNSGRIQLAS